MFLCKLNYLLKNNATYVSVHILIYVYICVRKSF